MNTRRLQKSADFTFIIIELFSTFIEFSLVNSVKLKHELIEKQLNSSHCSRSDDLTAHTINELNHWIIFSFHKIVPQFFFVVVTVVHIRLFIRFSIHCAPTIMMRIGMMCEFRSFFFAFFVYFFPFFFFLQNVEPTLFGICIKMWCGM